MHPVYKKTSFWIEFAITFFGLQLSLFAFARFGHWVEARPGVIVADPILALFSPVDLTWIIFAILYTSLLSGCIYVCYTNPKRFFMAGQAYSLMVLLRIFAMYLLPLDPPTTHIALSDPFVEFIGTSGKVLTRDLFFSGHTATMCVITIAVQHTKFRVLLMAATAIVVGCIIAQHVHYTVDVFVAVFVSYAAFAFVETVQAKFGWSRSLE